MKIIIEGTEKEIAALVVPVQERQEDGIRLADRTKLYADF